MFFLSSFLLVGLGMFGSFLFLGTTPSLRMKAKRWWNTPRSLGDVVLPPTFSTGPVGPVRTLFLDQSLGQENISISLEAQVVEKLGFTSEPSSSSSGGNTNPLRQSLPHATPRRLRCSLVQDSSPYMSEAFATSPRFRHPLTPPPSSTGVRHQVHGHHAIRVAPPGNTRSPPGQEAQDLHGRGERPARWPPKSGPDQRRRVRDYDWQTG